jgi:glutamate synthase (NADPH/NADH) small chain
MPVDIDTAELQIGEIVEHEELAERIVRMRIYAPQIAKKAQPGQFVILRLGESGERVPLTLVQSDLEAGTITLIIQAVGKSTNQLNAMQVGEVIQDVFGPLGNASEIKNYGTVVVVGGGVGAAVAFPVSKALKQAGNHVISIVGARNKDLVILKAEIEETSDEVYFTTDDGSFGLHGFVTDQLRILIEAGRKIDYILAVGPLPMMQAIAELSRPYKIPTTVSLNTIMVDGTGMCGGCRVQVGDQVLFTCVDGPEFDGHLVDFKTVRQRNRSYDHPEDCRLDRQIETLQENEETETLPHDSAKRQIPMPELPVAVRKRNFDEVATGYDHAMAIAEASRCIQCRNPRCVSGCPVSVQIPTFIKLLLEGKILEAGLLVKADNALPRVCGRVCPQSDQCQGACVLNRKGDPIAIGALERYVSDYLAAHTASEPAPIKQKKLGKVAVVGSGPASLACAGDLIKAGCEVVVLEAFHDFGGVLRYGIPEFRLPKQIVSDEVNSLKAQGVRFVANTLVGATYTIDDLMITEGFDAVFIGSGAGLPNFLNIPGESLVGVYSANEFLTRVNLMKAYQYPKVDTPILNLLDKQVAVLGGGNTALDSARVAVRMGAKEVSIVYRRSEAEMPGRVEEIEHAKAEGVNFAFLQNPVAFIGDAEGRLTGMRLIKMELGEPDSSGRRRPIPVQGSEFDIEVQAAIVAIGNGSNPIIAKTTPALNVDKRDRILVDEDTMATSIPGVFAGGDVVTGGATVILAMGAGRKAAHSILAYLQANKAED